ncbi:MAG: hypothetical protein IJY61_00470 [Candidatus Gastranaerophilales bacterium]|nr:hypothetical protein [Candidatus Gastranaerophilales bacterium]
MENYYEINYEKNMEMLEQAAKYCAEDFEHQDLVSELSSDDDLKKQLCLIELSKVTSQKEADILVNNLTGKSGPIRETTSFRILELIKKEEFRQFFQKKDILDIFVKSITDINPSVSRNAVEIITYVDDAKYLYDSIIREIQITLSRMDDIKQTRSYTTNKKNFNIYWNLEALISIADKIVGDEDLLEILKETAHSNDYTIREKTAKATMEFIKNNKEFICIMEILANDENVYVRKYLVD